MLLKDQLQGVRLLLASQSPRRRELMTGCSLPFELAPKYECEECYPASLKAHEVAEFLSRLKSEAYPHALKPDELLITADTTVLLDEQVLGKPKDRADAQRMLRLLSGRSHEVVTGVTLRSCRQIESFSSVSRVWFRPLRDEEIDYYIDLARPFDKAGAYGIQEWIGYAAIERIDGSFYNVMGLPIQKLYTELTKFLITK